MKKGHPLIEAMIDFIEASNRLQEMINKYPEKTMTHCKVTADLFPGNTGTRTLIQGFYISGDDIGDRPLPFGGGFIKSTKEEATETRQDEAREPSSSGDDR